MVDNINITMMDDQYNKYNKLSKMELLQQCKNFGIVKYSTKNKFKNYTKT